MVHTGRTCDVIVIGAGIAGASAAWHLARRGRSVCVLEQYDFRHRRGSSHGAARIFRLAYDRADYVDLARQAQDGWRELERLTGEELLWTMGGLDVGRADALQPLAAVLDDRGVPYERLAPNDLLRRYPTLHFPEDWTAIFQPDAGVLYAERCRDVMLELAVQHGARILSETPALALEDRSDGVVVDTAEATLEAEFAVVTAAGWASRLLAPLGLHIPLRITREHVAYYDIETPGVIPPIICHVEGAEPELYGLPNWRDGRFKLGFHGAGPEVDPDSEAVLERERLLPLTAFARQVLPLRKAEPVAAETCLYAATPDDDFVLDRTGNIVLGLGFGGHGFKFGSIIGGLLAGLAYGHGTVPRLFSRDRFLDPAGGSADSVSEAASN